VKLVSYRPAPLAEADVMPTKGQLERTRVKVVLLPPDDSAVRDNARATGAADVMLRAIEAKVSEGGSEIIDRTLSDKLTKEIDLILFRQKGTYGGPEVANYAVKGVVGNSKYKSEYVAAETVGDKKDKTTIPAHCDQKVEVASSIRVYELPSLRLVTTIKAAGSATSTTETYCNDSKAPALLRAAMEDGVHKARHDLKNVFAPKGYVIEKRVSDGKPPIFRVNFGSAQGATSKNKLRFYTIRTSENALTGKTYDEVRLGEGSVSDQVSDGSCWVLADGEETARAIRLGDYVKVFHEKEFLDFLNLDR
jgi:hypothetical protein